MCVSLVFCLFVSNRFHQFTMHAIEFFDINPICPRTILLSKRLVQFFWFYVWFFFIGSLADFFSILKLFFFFSNYILATCTTLLSVHKTSTQIISTIFLHKSNDISTILAPIRICVCTEKKTKTSHTICGFYSHFEAAIVRCIWKMSITYGNTPSKHCSSFLF